MAHCIPHISESPADVETLDIDLVAIHEIDVEGRRQTPRSQLEIVHRTEANTLVNMSVGIISDMTLAMEPLTEPIEITGPIGVTLWVGSDVRDTDFSVTPMSTSVRLDPGHRIRVEVSSSSFPRFARNLDTGGNSAPDTPIRIAFCPLFSPRL